MPVKVTVRVFSGRPNPSWSLTDPQVQQLLRRLQTAVADDSLKPYRLGGLGYHGFWIEASPDEQDPVLRQSISVYGGAIDFGTALLARRDEGRALERWLLDLAPLDRPILFRIQREFGTIYQDPQCQPGTGPRRVRAGRPVYNPALWSSAAVTGSNNCYSYANDLFTFTTGDHATPGESANAPVVFGNCSDFRAAAIKDKLKKLIWLPTSGAPIALFIAADESDFHWYRQDRSGLWSHKPGGWPVRDCDESGDPITNPKTADVLDYQFCHYFNSVPAAKAVIR